MPTPLSSQQYSQKPAPAEPTTLRRMRWFFLILMALWISGAMVLPVVAFCFTGNALSFTLYTTLAPPIYILSRIAGYLFPKDEKDFQLALTKIRLTAKKEQKRERVSS